ncbi:MAG: response regulator [Myxococcales bacterium]|nr:response regulator [Myxococcales bacterium]
MRQLLSLIAGAKGAEVEEARDGVGALKALSRARFDLVFLDLNMPVMDGHKVIQRIRDDASLAGTRIVVVSTEGADAAVQHALALGADGYLKKPVQRRAVEDVIRGVIQGARPGRAAGRAPAR